MKKRVLRLAAIILALCMCMGILVSCGRDGKEETTTESANEGIDAKIDR